MRKILYVCTNADEAGAPRHVEALVKRMSLIYEVMVVFGNSGPVSVRLSDLGFNVRTHGDLASEINFWRDSKALFYLFNSILYFRPNLVHCHSAKASFLVRIITALLNVPCIYTVHGWGWRGKGRLQRWLILFIEKALAYAPAVRYVYVAEHVAREAVDIVGVRARKGVVVYNGVAKVVRRENFGDSLTIVMPARVDKSKDHESLVRAFELADISGSRLILCGSGTDAADFMDNVKKWAPLRSDMVTLLGERSDMSKVYSMANVFALVSNFEALPISIIEAMSSGMAILASDVGGVSELIRDGVEGILVAPKDISGIAISLQNLSSRDLRTSLGGRAEIRYESKFREDEMVAALCDVYSRAIRELSFNRP